MNTPQTHEESSVREFPATRAKHRHKLQHQTESCIGLFSGPGPVRLGFSLPLSFYIVYYILYCIQLDVCCTNTQRPSRRRHTLQQALSCVRTRMYHTHLALLERSLRLASRDIELGIKLNKEKELPPSSSARAAA